MDNIIQQSIEFITEKDYYGFLYAVKRSTAGREHDVRFQGRCNLLGSRDGTTSSSATTSAADNHDNGGSRVKSQKRNSKFVFSMLSTPHGDFSIDSHLPELLVADQVITIQETTSTGEKKKLLELPLAQLKGMAITLDSVSPRPLLLSVSVLDNPKITIKFVEKPNKDDGPSSQQGSPTKIIKPSNEAMIATQLLLPLSFEEIHRSVSTLGISDEASELPFSVALMSRLDANIASTEATDILAEGVIPFSSFLRDTAAAAEKTEEWKLSDLKIEESIRVKTILKELGIRRGVRIHIHSAQGLPSSSSRSPNLPPTAYCTVYLVGPNNEKLTTNTLESRTEMVKSFDPTWDKQVILEGGTQIPGIDTSGLEGVAGVMVKVRDSASGLLKHHHIGQVVIPINCFLYRTEAKFTLPLEPTYR